jgi:hypothetical protein
MGDVYRAYAFVAASLFNLCRRNARLTQLRPVPVVLLASLLGSAGCAQTKSVAPIPISQQGDQNLTCAQIAQQIRENQIAAVSFATQAEQVEGRNVAFELGTVFTAWAALGIDLSKEDQIKMRSLQDRDQYLAYLKTEKKC